MKAPVSTPCRVNFKRRHFMQVGYLGLSLLLGSPLLFTASAHGGPQERASALVEQADLDYRERNFARAAQEYLTAYELVRRAWLFISAAEAFEMDGNIDLAIHYYQRYQKEDPEGIQNPEMSQKGREHLERLLRQRPGPPPAPASSAKALLVPRTSLAYAPPVLPGRGLRNAGVTLFVLGISALLASHGLGIGAMVSADRVQQSAVSMGAWSESLSQQLDHGRALAQNSYITLGVGAGVTLIGMSMWIAGSRRHRASLSSSRLPFEPGVRQVEQVQGGF